LLRLLQRQYWQPEILGLSKQSRRPNVSFDALRSSFLGEHARRSADRATRLVREYHQEITQGPLICKTWYWSYLTATKPEIDIDTFATQNFAEPHLCTAARLDIVSWIAESLSSIQDSSSSARDPVLNIRDDNNCTPLRRAIQYGHEDAGRLLLDSGAELDDLSVFIAVEEGHIHCLHLLLDRGGNPNALNCFGTVCALAEATGQGLHEIVRLLIEKGADPNLSVTVPALCMGIQSGSIDVVETLLPITEYDLIFMDLGISTAIRHRHHNVLRSLCRHFRQVAPGDIEVFLPLYLEAVLTNRSESMIAILLDELNLDANMQFPCHCPECMEQPYSLASNASAFDVLLITRCLLERGTILDAEDGISVIERAFFCATWNGHIGLLEQLTQRGVNINTRLGEMGHTALHRAVYRGMQDTVTFLITKGAEVDSRTTRGRIGTTPLMVAAMVGNETMVVLLLAYGAYRALVDHSGCRAVDYAISRTDYEVRDNVVSLLVDRRVHVHEFGNGVFYLS
jgi:ankyrin repeat protein